jgi:uncharacterized membrane protein YqjE
VGLGEALSGLASTTAATLRTRLELATVELEEQLERTKAMLFLVVIGTVFACFALIALSVLIVVLLWDSYRLAALSGLVLVYVVIAGIAFYALKASTAPRPFSATLRELERDAEVLKRRP